MSGRQSRLIRRFLSASRELGRPVASKREAYRIWGASSSKGRADTARVMRRVIAEARGA